MSKIKMFINNGVWIASAEVYGVEAVCTAGDIRTALQGLEADIKYLELNMYHAVVRGQKS